MLLAVVHQDVECRAYEVLDGNVVRARDKLEDLHGILDHGGIAGESGQKLRKALDEFDTYVVVNEALIPNYGERSFRFLASLDAVNQDLGCLRPPMRDRQI